MHEGYCRCGFEKTRNLSKFRLLSRFLKMFKFGANTTSLGREFHIGVTRFEKKNSQCVSFSKRDNNFEWVTAQVFVWI